MKPQYIRRCKILGCDQPLFNEGLCHKHSYDAVMTKTSIKDKVCKAEDCYSTVRSKGYCNSHYQQLLKYGKVTKKEPKPNCSYPQCKRLSAIKGLCKSHYTLERYYQAKASPKAQLKLHRSNYQQPSGEKLLCHCKGCDKPVSFKGYCRQHYYEISRYGHIRENTVPV